VNDIFGTEPNLVSFLTERKEYLGLFLCSMRTAYEITQQELSEATGYSIQTISKLENGKANPMGVAGRDIFSYLLQQSGNTLDEILQEFSIFCQNMQAEEGGFDEILTFQ
jgi:transcriptional regulator with XRE-family HTH domain